MGSSAGIPFMPMQDETEAEVDAATEAELSLKTPATA